MKRYRKIECLGSGGMGEVWLVHDEELGCYWAMKLIHATADAYIQRAFAQEIKILTRLHHPSIPRIVDRIYEDERMGVIMDLIDGIPLSKIKEPIPEDRLLDFAKQLLDMLQHIHAQGILYLDVKPENIILDQNGQLHLIDFGIARYAEEPYGESYGTIGFSPQEQYENQRLDERCDIYAFGKTIIALALGIHEGSALTSLQGNDTALSQGFRLLLDGCVKENAELRYPDVEALLYDVNHLEKMHLDFAKRQERKKRTAYLLCGIGTCCFMISFVCLGMDRYLRRQYYDTAIQNQNYTEAIAIDANREEGFYRLYEETYTEKLQAYRNSTTLVEALRMARSDALKRIMDYHISFSMCSEAFLYRIALDALLSMDEAWLNVAQEALSYMQEGEDQQVLLQLCYFMQEQLFLPQGAEEWLHTVTWKEHDIEIGMIYAQLYELHALEFTKEGYEKWQFLMEQLDSYRKARDDEKISEEMKQLLFLIRADSYYQYGRYLKTEGSYEDCMIEFTKLFQLNEEMKKEGYQDEMILYECGNAYLYLFQKSEDASAHLQLLYHAKAYYELALKLRPDFSLAVNGKNDCERLLAYWGQV